VPIVQVEMLEGRTVEQKRELAKLVTEAIVKSLQVPPTAVTIIIRDMANYNLASGGVLRADRE
jgi:4-oxalocrotonate tautomerase